MLLEQFKKFSKKPTEKIILEQLEVWAYTRVSSKDQEMNKSLANQKSAGEEFAKTSDYKITKVFGGVYESASGDFTRKEFSLMINEVKRARKKPFAILIYTMSRFSRTGGNGISLANELVEKLGVHLIEVSSGKNTLTPQGKNEIYSSLLQAHKENLDRIKVIVPGMKLFLKSGGWCGKPPRGYDTYGKRVKRDGFLNLTHKVLMNEEGRKIKLAWQWKLEYQQDFEIVKRLAEMGVVISRQDISQMWRKPFYCGVIVNKLLDEPVKGNWESMVTEEQFWAVQDIVNGVRNSGYVVEKEPIHRPLTLFLRCNKCEQKMSGYEVKKKKLHYYKCQKCKGATINANRGPKSLGPGAHEMFRSVLSGYQLDQSLVGPFIEQLTLAYRSQNEKKMEEEDLLRKELERLSADLISLQRNHAFGNLEKGLYEMFREEQQDKICAVTEKLSKVDVKISNLEYFINDSIYAAQNLSKYWDYPDMTIKRDIQDIIFPQGLYVDIENRTYLTSKVNRVLKVIRLLTEDKGNEKGDQINYLIERSPSVVSTGIEPVSNV